MPKSRVSGDSPVTGQNYPLRIRRCDNCKEKRMKNLFVGNMSFQTTEGDLRTMFEPFGEITRINVMTDRDRLKTFSPFQT